MLLLLLFCVVDDIITVSFSMIIITNRSRDIRIKVIIKVKNISTVIIIYFVIIVVISTIVFAIKIRPCQIDFLLGVTRAYAKKQAH